MPKLLVVDDDLDMLGLVRAALERDGHQVDIKAEAVFGFETEGGYKWKKDSGL